MLATVFLLYKEFLLASFDPVLAHTLGRRPELLRFVMLILLALHRGREPADRRRRAGGGHAGDAGRDRLPAHPAALAA